MQMCVIRDLAVLAILSAPLLCRAQGIITTVAGNGQQAFSGDGGPAIKAGVNPFGVVADKTGNLYISDLVNFRVRKVNTAGIISTVAGCDPSVIACILAGLGDGGPATGAYIPVFNAVLDGAGNLFIADNGHNTIRKVTPKGILSTVAGGGLSLGDGGLATSAQLNGPLGLAIDAAGSIYIADVGNNRIRKVNTAESSPRSPATGPPTTRAMAARAPVPSLIARTSSL